MKAKSTKAKTASNKKSSKQSALATCPVGNSGWCSFPFSAAQLQKRLKRAALEEQAALSEKELAGSAK